jgi:hypothetical protein
MAAGSGPRRRQARRGSVASLGRAGEEAQARRLSRGSVSTAAGEAGVGPPGGGGGGGGPPGGGGGGGGRGSRVETRATSERQARGTVSRGRTVRHPVVWTPTIGT